jgi:hypothetical protein
LNSTIYPGVDFVSYFEGQSPRYDFVVAPGANPSAIRLKFAGSKSVRVVDGDTLALGTVFGEQKIDGLYAYQKVDGKRHRVPARFVKNAKNEVSFAFGSYDKSKLLVIDPLVYGTYFGGNVGWDEVRAMSSDLTGGTYVAGYTESREFPRNQGPYGYDLRGTRDAFLSKLQGDAYANDYSVYIGGSGTEQIDFMNVDASGNVFVAGTTTSGNFPGRGVVGNGTGNRWIMRFAPNDTTVLSPFRGTTQNPVVRFFGNDVNGTDAITFLAGFGIPKPEGAAAQNVTRIVTGGTSNGIELAEVNTVDNGGLGNGEVSGAFYAEIDYNKSAQTFSFNQANSGYVIARGGTGINLTGVTVDNNGNTYLNGQITSNSSSNTATATTPRFDTTAGVYANGRLQRANDLYVRKLGVFGQVAYSALLGGSASESSLGTLPTRNLDKANSNPDAFPPVFTRAVDHRGPTIAADDNGNAYVVGGTVSQDYPRTRNTFGPEFQVSRGNVALTKISTNGDAILYSTNLNIGGIASVAGVSVDPRGLAYVTGMVGVTDRFNATVADPPVPNGESTVRGSVPTTADAERPAYLSPTAPQISATDGFFLAVSSDASNLVHGTYVGGVLDDATFAPYTDPFGDTFVYGWTETFRFYSLVIGDRSADPTNYELDATLDPLTTTGGVTRGFITPNALKATPENRNNGMANLEDSVLYGLNQDPAGTAPVGKSSKTSVPYITSNEEYPEIEDPDGLPPYKYTFAPYFASGGINYVRDGYVLRYRLSLPLISSLTLNPTTIPGGDASGNGVPASTTATLTLSSPAPAGGAAITLTLSNSSIASFNPSSSVSTTTITVPPGDSSVTFPVYSSPVLDVQNVDIRADYAGNVKVATLSIRPWLQALSVSTTTTIGGSGDAGPPSTFPTGTVRLEAPAQGDTRVILSSTSPLIRFLNSSGQLLTSGEVTVPNGQQTATFEYQTLATDTVVAARINASLLGVTRSQNITITPARLNRIVFDPAAIAGGSTTTGRVFLDGKAATARRIKVEILGVATNSGYALGGSGSDPRVTFVTIRPTSETSLSNQAAFSFTAGYEPANVTRTVRAVQVDDNGNEIGNAVTGTVLVLAQNISTVTVTPSAVESGGVVTVTATLADVAPAGGVKVSLLSSNQSLVPINVTLNVPQGKNSVSYSIKSGSNQTSTAASVTITAYRGSTTNGSAKTTTVTVNPLTYTVSINPTALFGGNTATGTITLPRTQLYASTFTVTAPAGSGVTVNPTTVTIPSGSLTGTFSIATTAVAQTKTVTLTVKLGTQTAKSVGLTIRAIQISSLTLSRSTIRSGETTRLTVTLDGAPSVDTTISLSYSNGTLISFPPVVIRAGQTSATVTSSPAARVPRTLTTSISASLGGNTASTTLTVER